MTKTKSRNKPLWLKVWLIWLKVSSSSLVVSGPYNLDECGIKTNPQDALVLVSVYISCVDVCLYSQVRCASLNGSSILAMLFWHDCNSVQSATEERHTRLNAMVMISIMMKQSMEAALFQLVQGPLTEVPVKHRCPNAAFIFTICQKKTNIYIFVRNV